MSMAGATVKGAVLPLLILASAASTSAAAAAAPVPSCIRLNGGGRRDEGWGQPDSGWKWPSFGGDRREEPPPSWFETRERDRARKEEERGFQATWGGPGKPTPVRDDVKFDETGFVGGIKNAFKNVQTPGIKWYLKPEKTKLKLRKRLYPLGLTRLTVGVDYDPMAGEWSIKTSWKDTVVGGHVNIHGSEIALTKDFQMDDRNALWLKCAWDWQTKKSLIGFTLKPLMGLSAMRGMDRPGWSFRKRVPLNDNLQIEVDSIIEMPEATYTTSSAQGMCLGIGDFKVDLKQLNLVVEF